MATALKILLIKPNICVRKGYELQSKKCPPLGLAYLAGSLIKAGFHVNILDMVAATDEYTPYGETHVKYGMTEQQLTGYIKENAPGLIGIGGFTTQYGCIKEIVAAIKSFDSTIKIVLGGIHATAMSQEVLGNTEADYIIQGEGESGIVVLAKALDNCEYSKIRDIDGIAYKEDGNVVVKPRLCFQNNLDAIPWPARELLDHEKYLKDEVAMPVITSRGCPGRCTFCSVHLSSGCKWRPRDPVEIADEIEDTVTRWGYKTISVFDDACNVKPQRMIELCQEIIRRSLRTRLTFPGGLIVRYITRDLLYWIKQAGAVSLSLPVEHVNTFMRNSIIKKNLNIEKVFQVLDWCRELKLLALVNFVIGMPGETEETLQEIISFVKENACRIDSLSVYIATPFPGTEFYDSAAKNGYLTEPEKDRFLDFDLYTSHLDTEMLPHTKVTDYKHIIEKTFADCRGPNFPVDYIRKAIRKPNKETESYIDDVYFSEAVGI
ncbi:MAG: B12-binding domain-containing radical SAM protein [Planctomycetota bacterium]|jgi:radical SAM superfamily enzyme YgiQ (UPF0313 family)